APGGRPAPSRGTGGSRRARRPRRHGRRPAALTHQVHPRESATARATPYLAPPDAAGQAEGADPDGSAPPAVLRLSRSLLVATLVTRLAQQLAVLLLRHPLAALLDHRAHGLSFVSMVMVMPRRRAGRAGHRLEAMCPRRWPGAARIAASLPRLTRTTDRPRLAR